ncbi:IclR family transcriptional regulator [Streptomyces malaysiensis]|uniref:IclR family transcriptional regulator n=1 Tax=Streptomyces malaysiensis TaxID=92644 RepID=UPI002B304EBD|nr:IclR family transcriptional regulator [Streptomyces malaysiensis]
MRNHKPDTLYSVDSALRVLELLSQRPSLRVIEVAEHLDVARSTAHRILSTLLSRGFVVQDAHKVYHVGPAVERLTRPRISGPKATRDLTHPYLERLADMVGETCHVAVLEGNGTRFIDSVESVQVLKVGSRVGMLLPAHKTAIGIALLAELPLSTLRSIYPRGLTGEARVARQTLRSLDRKIGAVRRTGFATNFGESDPGISAVGTCLRDPHGRAFAGIAVAIPTPRFDQHSMNDLTKEISDVVDVVRNDLAEIERAATIACAPPTESA